MEKPMDILSDFPVRKSKKQKQAFRQAVQAYCGALGYETVVEKGGFGAKNLVIGNPKTAKYLITAHYDTCARLPFPNLLTPCSFPLFLGYQILLALGILTPPVILTMLTALLTRSTEITKGVWILSACAVFGMVFAGKANRHNANDNTSGVVTVLEIAKTMPKNLRGQACFMLFDLEEAGLFGSSAYQSAHKQETKNQVILNFDCVGDGDQILFFPTKKLKKDKAKLSPLYGCCGYFGKKSVLIRDKGFSVYPSDQGNFPYGVGIAAFRKGKLGLYLSRIHTDKDTILEETNVNILRAAIISMIGSSAAQ